MHVMSRLQLQLCHPSSFIYLPIRVSPSFANIRAEAYIDHQHHSVVRLPRELRPQRSMLEVSSLDRLPSVKNPISNIITLIHGVQSYRMSLELLLHATCFCKLMLISNTNIALFTQGGLETKKHFLNDSPSSQEEQDAKTLLLSHW